MADILSRIPSMKDAELRVLQANARRRLEQRTDSIAEQVLAAIDDAFADRHLPGAIRRFKADFPDLFKDSRYLDQERRDKLRASEYCREQLSKTVFEGAKTPEQAQALLSRVKDLVTMLNLLEARFERPIFLDKIGTPGVTAPFLAALNQLMWGNGPHEDRLEAFCDRAADWGLRKWTYASYFLFLAHPTECMFVKPESIKKALDTSPHPLTYESTPSSTLYRGILDFSGWLKGRLAALNPVDMIDVQSFIWYMAPTGKFARD